MTQQLAEQQKQLQEILKKSESEEKKIEKNQIEIKSCQDQLLKNQGVNVQQEVQTKKMKKEFDSWLEKITKTVRDNVEIELQDVREKSKQIVAQQANSISKMEKELEREKIKNQTAFKEMVQSLENLKRDVSITKENQKMEELTKRFHEERKCLEKKNNEIEIQLQTEKRKYEELRENHETVVFKMEEERKTLSAELESIKAEDSLNQMRSRDLSTLATAVGSKDKDQVKLVLDELDVDINARMRHENKIEGSVLVLAVQDEDLEMLKMLVQDLGANVNQEIILDGKQSTHLIMAMAQVSSRYFKILFRWIIF